MTVRAGGFTLLELLVVLAIAGVLLSVASLSFAPVEARRLEEEAERLALLFRLAQDESRASGRPLAWRADARGYRFVRPGSTEVREATDPLRPRLWPFTVVRLDAPEITFGREPLLRPVAIRLVTPGGALDLRLDAFGILQRAPAGSRS